MNLVCELDLDMGSDLLTRKNEVSRPKGSKDNCLETQTCVKPLPTRSCSR